MSELIIYGEVLTANAEERTISGLLLPWEEVGHTSAGSLIASKGTLTLPSNPTDIFLNLQHQPDSRVGRAISLEEREDGLHATFRIAKTTAGNDLLEEVKEGLRAHLSIEITKPRYANGRILAGLVSGAAAVCTPAFKSAAVYQLTAADHNPTPETETKMDNITPETNEVSTPVQAVPNLTASDKKDIAKLTFEAAKSGFSVQAALADLKTTDDVGKVYIADQEVGALFEARRNERKLVEAVGVKPLNSLFVTGTRKTRTFAVQNWAGNKAELPTGKFTSSRENWQATPKAVAVDIAMELIEFGSEEVIADLYEQAIDSYIEQTENELTAVLLAEGTQFTLGGAAIEPLDAVSAAAQYLGSIGARMDFVVCSADVYAGLTSIVASNAPWWLTGQGNVDLRNGSANVGGIALAVNYGLPEGTILVGDSRAVDYRESKDFKYRALDVAHGGVDVSFIKFRATKVTDPAAIAVFTTVNGGTPVEPDPEV